MTGNTTDDTMSSPTQPRTPPVVAGTLATEVLIVGGGMAGLTLAAALGTAGVPVICVDRDPQDLHLRDGFDGRTTAIAYGSRQAMAGAGIWRHLAEDAEAIRDIRVADSNSPLFLHYDHRELEGTHLGGCPFGYIVENRLIRRALFRRLGELSRVTHLAPASVVDLDRSQSGVRARLSDGRTVAARLVVGADGRGSPCRRWAGIGVMQWDYPQTAIVCTIAHELPHDGIAVEHFLPAGPFAVLPMTENRSSIVWTERALSAADYLALDDDAFTEELQRRIGGYLGAIRPIGPRFSYPLSVMHADRYVDRRLALVGEAAHAIHPIAGQGLNMGLRDVAALAEVIVDTYRLGLDVGSPDCLDRYQRWRRFDNLLLVGVTDTLNRLFSNDIPPLRLARDVGLAVVNRVPPMKRFFMRHAMGMVGTLPRLVRGEPL